MISFICSSREPKEEFKEHIIKMCGIDKKKVEFLFYKNNGEFSLTEIYNRGLKETKYNINVYLHDDITVDTKQFGQKILNHFNDNSEYGIIGVAGSKFLPNNGKWWDNPKKMYGRVKHTHEGKTWLSSYSDDLGQNLEEVVVVDGVFFAVNKERIKKSFNKDVTGFHFYDVNFCFENYLSGVKIGVFTNIRINHQSIGQTNDAWENSRLKFSEKYVDVLPVNIKKTFNNGEKMKVLISDKSITKEDINLLIKNNTDITLLDNDKFVGVKNMLLNNPNGYKLGDGKSLLKINGGEYKMELNKLYRINNFEFDIIYTPLKNQENNNLLLQLYPNSKVLMDNISYQDLFSKSLDVINFTKNNISYDYGVTFIIPTINRESLEQSINSLKSQTNSNWFCKVIFDGVDVIDFNDDRIECVKIEKNGFIGPNNGQAGLVRNIGIGLVKTEWVAFLDDDDTVNSDYVDLLLNKYNNRDFVIFKMKYKNGLVLPKDNTIIFGNVGISIAFKNSLESKFKNNRDGEDFDFIIDLKNKSSNFCVSDEIMYNVRC